jgi:hypothetical protein
MYEVLKIKITALLIANKCIKFSSKTDPLNTRDSKQTQEPRVCINNLEKDIKHTLPLLANSKTTTFHQI